MPTLHAHCPLCDSKHLDDLYLNVNGFTITRCQACRLVFVKEKLATNELLAYYNQADGEYIYADPENVENLNYYFRKLGIMIEKQRPAGRILDVGCSAGYFLDVMKNWDCYGIEIPSIWAEMASAKYGNHIHIGTLDDSNYPDEYFDVITLQDVFDHLSNPLECLAICKRILKPNGMIVIKVHNIECLYARLVGRNFYAIIPPFHLFYYSKNTLKRALEKSGFSFQTSAFIGHSLFLKTIPYRLAQTNRSGIFFKTYQMLDKIPLGNIKIPKNLHDIITVFGVKQPDTP